eukprot:g79716.t1
MAGLSLCSRLKSLCHAWSQSKEQNKFQAGSWLSSGVTLKEYHLSAVKEDVPLKPLPADWKTLPKKEVLAHLLQKALERRSVDVGPGAVQFANKEHQMQAWSKYARKENDDLTSRLAASHALVASFEAALQQEREQVASLNAKLAHCRTKIRHKKRLETAKSELNKKRKLNCEAKSQYEKLESDWLKEQEAHKDNLQKSMNLQKETM